MLKKRAKRFQADSSAAFGFGMTTLELRAKG
jgi:hypothetical protein